MRSSIYIRVHLKMMKMQERRHNRADLEVMMLTFLNEWKENTCLAFYITVICIRSFSLTVFLSLLFFSASPCEVSQQI